MRQLLSLNHTTKPATLMANQRGGITLIALVLFPLMLAITASVGGAALLIKFYSETQHACRQGVLSAEETLLDGLERLQALNPQAQQLRSEREAAEKALVAASDPASQAAAQTYLFSVIARQLALRAKQKILISTTEMQAHRVLTSMKQDQQENLRRSAEYLSRMDISFTRPRLAVIAKPANSLSPDYVTEPAFSFRQALDSHWKFDAAALIPRWFPVKLGRSSMIRGQCHSAPERDRKKTFANGEIKWIARLGKGKPWSR